MTAPTALHSAELQPSLALERIAFGSCYAPQLERRQIWQAISAVDPQLLLLLGDNVYQSEELGQAGLRELRQAYGMLAGESEFAQLRAQSSVLATWDDHDYGLNDAGGDFAHQAESEQLFEAVWPLPAGGWRSPGKGIYSHLLAGPDGRRVQILMLDTRSFRSDWPEPESAAESTATLLGPGQWAWLRERLQQPAELRLLVSSIPVLSERRAGEGWWRMPAERERLLELLADRSNGALLILSGDAHFGAQFERAGETGLTVEWLSSSLNFPINQKGRSKLILDDPARVGEVIFEANFGLLEIDWEKGEASLSLRSEEGRTLLAGTLPLR